MVAGIYLSRIQSRVAEFFPDTRCLFPSRSTMADSHPIRPGRARWSLFLAAIVLLAGVAGTLMLHHGLQAAEEASVDRHVRNLARFLEIDMLGDLSEQINAQHRMATRLVAGGMSNGESWRLNADLYLQHHPYYRTLAVLEPNFRIRWIHTLDESDLQPGQPYPVDDQYRQRLESEFPNGGLVVKRPRELSDGMPGITFITPVGDSENLLGYLAAVLVIPDSIEAMVPALFREEMDLRAISRGWQVYPHPATDETERGEWDAGFVIDLDSDGTGMEIMFALNEASREQLTTVLPSVVLFSGLLLSGLLALVAWLGMNARVHAGGLARSNELLEIEVQEREQAEKNLAFLVSHDSLTGLPNRVGSTNLLEEFIVRHARGDHQLALLILDLDQFKDINDSLGHQLGDRLLCEIPRRLQGVLRDRDFLGRHGGDEFLVAVVRESREQVEQLACNVLRAFDDGFTIEDHRLFISASIGIAYCPESGRTVTELIQNADTALFKAKHGGRNQFAVFTREMFDQAQHRLNLSRDIRHALENEDFRLVYQPIVDVEDLSLVGLEALLRWQHREGYMVPPQDFIRVAEETGIIGRLGQFALESALRDLAEWQNLTEQSPWLAVNISGAQILETGFAEQLSVLLHRNRIDPELLHLEITEEVLIENLLRNRRTLQELDEIGMRIAVDDFGVGYSSLAYLKNFPISVIKIDRGFVRDLPTDAEDQAITRTICELSRELGMRTVAEGVEDVEQLELLRSYRCSHAQGFLFSRPVERDEVANMIRGQCPWLQ